ncbi:hypothetical protein HDU89_003355 [Geranomyces variabilis]|nr:hypothetical protein HDU89_003355 [Geranomyces variabilis]
MDAATVNKYFPLILFGGLFLTVVISRLLQYLGIFKGFQRDNIIQPPSGQAPPHKKQTSVIAAAGDGEACHFPIELQRVPLDPPQHPLNLIPIKIAVLEKSFYVQKRICTESKFALAVIEPGAIVLVKVFFESIGAKYSLREPQRSAYLVLSGGLEAFARECERVEEFGTEFQDNLVYNKFHDAAGD